MAINANNTTVVEECTEINQNWYLVQVPLANQGNDTVNKQPCEHVTSFLQPERKSPKAIFSEAFHGYCITEIYHLSYFTVCSHIFYSSLCVLW